MMIAILDTWDTALESHDQFVKNKILKKLSKLGNTSLERHVCRFVLENLDHISHGRPDILIACIGKFEKEFGKDIYRACATEIMAKIFDYTSFTAIKDGQWDAYQLCTNAKYKVCCYCHINPTETSLPNEEEKGYRPPIDHYYGKADYPFLSLSIYNFIPSCEKCNGPQMKGATDFAKLPHLNPLTDEECISITLEPKATAVSSLAEAASLSLAREQYCIKVNAPSDRPDAKASIATFQLQSRYNEYAHQAYYLAKKVRGLSARLGFHKEALNFTTELEDYLEFKPDEYKNVPYGKARLCIAKQFGAEL